MELNFSDILLEGFLSNYSSRHCDSGLSSLDSFSQDAYLPVPLTKSFANIFIEEKKKYWDQIASNIESTKEGFLRNCSKVYYDIEKMTWQVSCYVQRSDRDLKVKLQEIRERKTREWERQLRICKSARLLLENLDEAATLSATTVLDTICNSNFSKEIGAIDTGEIRFESGDFTVLEVLQKLGRISCDSGTGHDGLIKNPTVSNPKFIIKPDSGRAAEFCRPWGVCTDVTGRILVADRSNNKIKIFNEHGEFLLEFGKEGSKPGEFSRPAGITVDNKCRIFVADKDNHRIQIFTYSGGFLYQFGSRGSRHGEFHYPWDVAVNKNCDIAVSDSKNRRVQLFNENGFFLASFGFGGSRANLRKFDSPRGLAFCSDGSLLVTDFNNHRVLMINPTFTSYKKFGQEGHRPGQFFRPQGIAYDGSGKFAVADSKNYRIQVFDMHGNLYTLFGSQGGAPGQFDCPQGICFHPNGSIIVVDLSNNRVQVF